MANRIYRALETAITFRDSSGDVVLSLQNLAAGAGRVSARHDRGADSRSEFVQVRAVMQFETAPVVGETVEIYLFGSDNTYMDGTLGASDAALTSDKRRNGKLIGHLVVDTTSATTDIVASFPCTLLDRYFSIGVWNGTADNLENTANASRVIMTPMPLEVQ